ncbi:MAG: hypothetical protein CLLPBCKN_004101 [Chroococcidiopsis cubana SAG 39.79]|nr:hypothetical protein [Chroococcidiopsis cubana SAG 39.79]
MLSELILGIGVALVILNQAFKRTQIVSGQLPLILHTFQEQQSWVARGF